MIITVLDAKTLGSDIDLSPLRATKIYQNTKGSQIIPRLKNADIIITNKINLNSENLPYAARLKLICLTATGYNNVDIDYCAKHGIAVCNVPNYCTDSVAQHTFALLLSLLEKIRYYDDYVKSGRYSKSGTANHLGMPFFELSGKIWGIIGMGNIGKRVARIAESFGCRVIYYSVSGKSNTSEYERTGLDEILGGADIITVHAPLTDRTLNLITYKEMCKMKKTAYLVNVGRGGIVNEEDLARALDESLIAGAALDVFSHEPLPLSSPLLKIKNRNRILFTPHIAWSSIEARNRVVFEVGQNIAAFLRGEARNRIV